MDVVVMAGARRAGKVELCRLVVWVGGYVALVGIITRTSCCMPSISVMKDRSLVVLFIFFFGRLPAGGGDLPVFLAEVPIPLAEVPLKGCGGRQFRAVRAEAD